MVKELRERTGAGMMECKKALVAADGDMEAAITEMRKSGQAKAAKRAGRVAAEGTISMTIAEDNKTAFMAEINSETDFVARDDNFKKFVEVVGNAGLSNKTDSVESLLAVESAADECKTLEDERAALVHKIGENINVRRVVLVSTGGIVGGYRHGDKIGVLVELEGGGAELAKDIAMHVAAMNPAAIDENDMPEDSIEKEKEIFIAQAKESGKPDEIIEKMITGRIAKFIKESSLLGQAFVKDQEKTIAALLKEKGAKVVSFTRFEVGDGIEKETVDFAEEVRAQVQGS